MVSRNKVLFIILLACSIFIIISQNFGAQGTDVLEFLDWTTYEVTPGNWAHVSFQDSVMGQIIPIIGYFPTIIAGLAFLGTFLIFVNIHASKIIFKIAGILTIVGFIIYILPSLILGIVGSYIPLPNLAGAYFFLIPGILLIILSIFIKKTEIGYAKADKEYYAIGKKQALQSLPSGKELKIQCPQCGAMVPADQLFCDECGKYF